MQFDFEAMLASERYKLLLATVLPRPIAWVSTRDARGAVNAAPFSFFNVFGNDPATVGIGIGSKGPAEPKDTRANIRETEHFVVNLVPFSLAQQMRVTSIAFPKGVEEPSEAGLSPAASDMIVVVDDEDRENEGDLVMTAEMITPKAINFRAIHGRGLICLAMTGERLDELELAQVASDNTALAGTALLLQVDRGKRRGERVIPDRKIHRLRKSGQQRMPTAASLSRTPARRCRRSACPLRCPDGCACRKG